VTTGIAHLDREGRPIPAAPTGPSSRFYQLFVKGFGPTPSAVMVRRAILEKAGGFDERFGSAGLDDHELWPRLAQLCEFALVDEPLTFHRHRLVKPPQIELGHRAVLNEALLKRFGHEPQKRRYLMEERAAYLADLGKWRCRQGDLAGGRAALAESLAVSFREALRWKTVWRAASRLLRSYV